MPLRIEKQVKVIGLPLVRAGLVGLVCLGICLAFSVPAAMAAASALSPGRQGAPAAPVPGVGDVDQDLAQARARLKEKPSSANHVTLAQLFLRKGMLDDAMSSFDEALKLNPRAYEAKTGRGVVLARKGNLKEAEQVLLDALVNNPSPVRTHYELGVLYQQLGQFEKAVAEFKSGIAKYEQGR